MRMKLVSLVIFSIVGLSESIILKKEFEELKTTLKSSLNTLVQKINKKASIKSVKSEILNINKEAENLRNETNSDVAKLNSVIIELQRTISKLEEKLNGQVQRLDSKVDSNVGELKENLDDLEQDFSKSNARSRSEISQLHSSIYNLGAKSKSEISQLYSHIDDLELGLTFDGCRFNHHETDSNDVVVGQHGETYSGLTEVSYDFVASIAGTAFLNKYAIDHAHYYGFREFTTDYQVFCTSDNKHISTDMDDFITFSKSDGSYVGSTYGVLNYRPKICGYPSDKYHVACEQDWSLIHNVPGNHETQCANNRQAFGLFVKSHLYNKIAAACDLTAVR